MTIAITNCDHLIEMLNKQPQCHKYTDDVKMRRSKCTHNKKVLCLRFEDLKCDIVGNMQFVAW